MPATVANPIACGMPTRAVVSPAMRSAGRFAIFGLPVGIHREGAGLGI
jgi:hypothetical protein